MIEIERKFLVKTDEYISLAFSKDSISQGFLNTDPERTVRVRIKNKEGYLTVKGKSNFSGTSRFEWETRITFSDAVALLELCEPEILIKDRYSIKVGNHIIEVDVFKGKNLGLIVAEIELNDEEEKFIKPLWLGEEVTGQLKYYNSRLSKFPYLNW